MGVTGVVRALDLIQGSTAGEEGSLSDKPCSIRIEAGAYTTPFTLIVQGGPTLTITSLPWQGVVVGSTE